MSLWDHVFEDRRQAAAVRAIHAPKRRFHAGRGIAVRGHNAAKVDRLTQDWPTAPVPTDSMLKADLQKLRARSRWEVENDDYAARFLSLLETNVIGESGIRPNPRVVTADGVEDVAMNEAIVIAWEEWGGPEKLCDIGGRMSWQECERLFIRTAAEDGEVLVQEVRGTEAGKFGYALHFIDPELLDINAEYGMTNGRYARLGVELDSFHRPTGYWLKDNNADQSAHYLGYFAQSRRLYSAEDIIHAFVMKRVGQKRGLPWMSTALFRLKMLTGFEDAAAVAARAGAAQMGAIQREATGEEVPLDDEEGEGGPRIIETEPGVWIELKPGETLHDFTPAYPNETFEPFVKSILRGCSAGMNVSYNAIANDLEHVNYSSMRAGKSDENDAWRLLQRWTWRAFHQRVYTNFLVMAAMTGNLNPVDGRVVSSEEAREMSKMVDWDARGWEAVDPAKELRAREMEIRSGLRSREEIIKARGGNPDRVWRQLAKEQRLLLEMGVLANAVDAEQQTMRDYMTDLIREIRDEDEEEGGGQ